MDRGIAILQARMGSTRLPGKVLKLINDKPMLYYTIQCLKSSEGVGDIVIATSTLKKDDPIEKFATDNGCKCFRGSEEDVLGRFYQASLQYESQYYFRGTGDNPVVDPMNPVRSLKYLVENGLDYCCESGMPVGTVVEVFTSDALKRCQNIAKEADDREHVTLLMKRSKEFSSEFHPAPLELRAPEISMTVDYKEDFDKVSFVIEELSKGGVLPPFNEILKFIKKVRE